MVDDWLLIVLVAWPAAGAFVCLAYPRPRHVLAIIQAVSGVELLLALLIAVQVRAGAPLFAAVRWLHVDALSAFHLVVLGLVFVLCSLFAGVYFLNERRVHAFTRRIARRFGSLWLGSLAAMALVLASNSLGIMWVGMEATTLLTAFLISMHPDRFSLEAMWKYLVICSVGIAFAFMGTLLAAAAVRGSDLAGGGLLWTELATQGVVLDPVLMKFAFAFLVVGYGAKAGLAPIHSWLPDAHSQAPAPVSAMFSGFLLNTALYCIVRYLPLVSRATGDGFAEHVLLVFGVLSVLVEEGNLPLQHRR